MHLCYLMLLYLVLNLEWHKGVMKNVQVLLHHLSLSSTPALIQMCQYNVVIFFVEKAFLK